MPPSVHLSGAHSLISISYKTVTDMDSPSTSRSSTSRSSSTDNMSIVTTLFPPKIFIRARSLSNVTLASSRSGTPVPSIAPSTPHLPNLSPRSSEEIQQSHFLELVPRFAEYLDARDILNLSQTTRHSSCHDLRTSHTFRRYLTLNGWDTEALVRRIETTNESKGRPWMFLARSALDKDDILKQYALLPKLGEKKALAKDKKDRITVEKFMHILIDVVTEHDRHNFTKLTSLANSLQLSFIQFVTAIPAFDWKARYRKTFVIATFANIQPPYPEGEDDLEKLSDTLDFEDPKPPLSLVAARANFLYTYGCISYTATSPKPILSKNYDPPHLRSSRGTSLPGLRQGIERFACRISVNGFYRKAGGEVTSMRMAIDPVGLASKSRLPFTEKQLLTLTATVSDGEGNSSWQMEGSIDRNTGIGKLKSVSGMVYELWVTPWGLTGQKIRGEGKHLGYFVLHWA